MRPSKTDCFLQYSEEDYNRRLANPSLSKLQTQHIINEATKPHLASS